jgi:uncharacterized protein with HEPN domain
MKKETFFLQHIIDSINILENYIKNLTKEKFLKSISKQDLVVRRLEIIGEAVKNLPSTFRENYPQIEWKEIAGTRDVLIHSYFAVDYDLVWNIVKKDIPKLKKVVNDILK